MMWKGQNGAVSQQGIFYDTSVAPVKFFDPSQRGVDNSRESKSQLETCIECVSEGDSVGNIYLY